MMVLSALRPDASLLEFLAHRARLASVRRLTIDAIVGFIGSAAALWWKPDAWLTLATVALIFVAYGGWGILDRARSRETLLGKTLVVAMLEVSCALFTALGVVAAAGLLFSVWTAALGTWIS